MLEASLYLLGQGHTRTVYGCGLRKNLVAKIAWDKNSDAGLKANFLEWSRWEAFKDIPEIAKWLCPVVDLKGMGVMLTMARAKPVSGIDDLTLEQIRSLSEFPVIFNDVHWGNLGIYEDRVVLIDYGNVDSIDLSLVGFGTAPLLYKDTLTLVPKGSRRVEFSEAI